MGCPFFETHEQAIGYEEFAICGWSADEYFSYCNQISRLRATLIMSVENRVDELPQDMARDVLESLLVWVGQACGGLRCQLRGHGHGHDPHPRVADPVDGERERGCGVVGGDDVGGQERERRPAERG